MVTAFAVAAAEETPTQPTAEHTDWWQMHRAEWRRSSFSPWRSNIVSSSWQAGWSQGLVGGHGGLRRMAPVVRSRPDELTALNPTASAGPATSFLGHGASSAVYESRRPRLLQARAEFCPAIRAESGIRHAATRVSSVLVHSFHGHFPSLVDSHPTAIRGNGSMSRIQLLKPPTGSSFAPSRKSSDHRLPILPSTFCPLACALIISIHIEDERSYRKQPFPG